MLLSLVGGEVLNDLVQLVEADEQILDVAIENKEEAVQEGDMSLVDGSLGGHFDVGRWA